MTNILSSLIDQIAKLFQICKFLKKLTPLGCNYLTSIPYLRKENIPLKKFIFSGNDEKSDSKENFDVLPYQKFSKLEIFMASFATHYQLPFFHLRT